METIKRFASGVFGLCNGAFFGLVMGVGCTVLVTLGLLSASNFLHIAALEPGNFRGLMWWPSIIGAALGGISGLVESVNGGTRSRQITEG